MALRFFDAIVESDSDSSPSLFTPARLGAFAADASLAQDPAGAPPTPRHTGIKALTKHLVTNFKYLPSKENLIWAGSALERSSARASASSRAVP